VYNANRQVVEATHRLNEKSVKNYHHHSCKNISNLQILKIEQIIFSKIYKINSITTIIILEYRNWKNVGIFGLCSSVRRYSWYLFYSNNKYQILFIRVILYVYSSVLNDNNWQLKTCFTVYNQNNEMLN